MLMVLEKYHGRNWVAIAFIHEGIILVPIHLFVGELISTLGLKVSRLLCLLTWQVVIFEHTAGKPGGVRSND